MVYLVYSAGRTHDYLEKEMGFQFHFTCQKKLQKDKKLNIKNEFIKVLVEIWEYFLKNLRMAKTFVRTKKTINKLTKSLINLQY